MLQLYERSRSDSRIATAAARKPAIVSNVRVLGIGPANYAEQAFRWARAVERFLGVRAVSFASRRGLLDVRRSGELYFQVDRLLPHHRLTPPHLKALLMRNVLRGVSHLAIDGFLPIYRRIDSYSVADDLPRLRQRGLNLALIAHGGDVRSPDQHIAQYDFSYFAVAPKDWVHSLRATSARNRRTAAEFGGPTFVSTPDLVTDLPFARWLPLCIEPSDWLTSAPVLTLRRPRVLHVPSRRVPPIKGTAIIDSVLTALAEKGRIDYISPDRATRARMIELVRSADIVVDQILTGSYGAAAVEAMAAGKVVVGFVGDEVRRAMPEPPTIVDAPPPVFESTIHDILDHRLDYAELARRGPMFVRDWHDGRESSKALAGFLAQPPTVEEM